MVVNARAAITCRAISYDNVVAGIERDGNLWSGGNLWSSPRLKDVALRFRCGSEQKRVVITCEENMTLADLKTMAAKKLRGGLCGYDIVVDGDTNQLDVLVHASFPKIMAKVSAMISGAKPYYCEVDSCSGHAKAPTCWVCRSHKRLYAKMCLPDSAQHKKAKGLDGSRLQCPLCENLLVTAEERPEKPSETEKMRLIIQTLAPLFHNDAYPGEGGGAVELFAQWCIAGVPEKDRVYFYIFLSAFSSSVYSNKSLDALRAKDWKELRIIQERCIRYLRLALNRDSILDALRDLKEGDRRNGMCFCSYLTFLKKGDAHYGKFPNAIYNKELCIQSNVRSAVASLKFFRDVYFMQVLHENARLDFMSVTRLISSLERRITTFDTGKAYLEPPTESWRENDICANVEAVYDNACQIAAKYDHSYACHYSDQKPTLTEIYNHYKEGGQLFMTHPSLRPCVTSKECMGCAGYETRGSVALTHFRR